MTDVQCPLCPCESLLPYDACCGPLLTTERLARTAEELMRSRYTAYFYGNREHLWRTWHPRTRPAEVMLEQGTRWTGLRIDDTEAGGEGDDSGIVEFTASYDDADGSGRLHERSRFERRGGRWLYLDGVTGD